MDVTLQAHEAKLVFPVPQGLRELASDISREVLREQPSNIYGFMADYCAALLRTRDNCIAAADIVSQLLDRDITFAAMLERKGLRLEDAHHAAIVIQSAFRGHRERQRVKTMDVDAHYARIEAKRTAANVIQAAFRGYRTRKTIRSIENINYDDVYHSPIIEAMLLRTGHSWNEAQSAAMSIQRAYRAFKLRQAFAAGSAVINPMEVIQGILEATKHTLAEASVAAVAIQETLLALGVVANRSDY